MSISEHVLEKLKANDEKLIDLSIGSGAFGDEGAAALAEALKNNTNLQSIELGNSNIGPDGAVALANALTKSSGLKTLYLRGNKIGDEGSEALAEALKMNNCLEHLYLGGNEIGIKGVKAFADAFTKNSTLETIYLRNNHVGDEGSQILADALVKNFGLRVLNVANAELTEVGCRTFLKLMEVNTTLHSVVFEHNGVDSEEIVKAFAEREKYNSSLAIVTSNTVAKKILRHCEEFIEFEKIREDKRQLNFEQLAEKFSLTRAEQYHWSGVNLQGNSILCVAFLSRMIFGKYSDKTASDELMRVVRQLYEKLLLRVKEDIANPKTAKPNQEILNAANQLIS